MRKIDLSGEVFDKWKVLERQASHGKKTKYLCRCQCGAVKLVNGSDLVTGKSRQCTSCGNYQKKDYGVAECNRLIRSYKKNAANRGLEFLISDEECKALFKQACHYCGWLESNNFQGKYDHNGIDRKNNKLGYIAGNVLPCCYVCNRAKNSMSYNMFIGWANRLSVHRLYGHDLLAEPLELEKSKEISLDLELMSSLGLAL